MEGLVLVAVALALLSPCYADQQQNCKKGCPQYERRPDIQHLGKTVEVRLYEPTDWLSTSIPDLTIKDVTTGSNALKSYCNRMKDLDDELDCDRWPVQIAFRKGKISLLWPVSHKVDLPEADGVKIEKKPAQLVYAYPYTGYPDKETGSAKHTSMMEVLYAAGIHVNPDDYTGAAYDSWNIWGIYHNDVLIVADE